MQKGPSLTHNGSSQQDNESASLLRTLILGIAQALVDHPEQVKVEIIRNPTGTTLQLTVASSDLGQVIGKQGRTARSIRTILVAATMKAQQRFALDIVTPSA